MRLRDDAGERGHPVLPALGFKTRLVITLVVTIAAVGATQYLLAARQLTKRVVEQTTTGHRADARVLRALHDGAAGDPWPEVRELLGHIASRPGIDAVALVAPEGDVLAVGMARHGGAGPGAGKSMSTTMPDDSTMSVGADSARSGSGMSGMTVAPAGFQESKPLPAGPRGVVENVLMTGEAFGGEDPRSSNGDGLFVVPVDLAGKRYALAVVKEPGLISAQLADMRWVLLLTLALGVPIGLPVFYLLGGRSLNARYMTALQRSSRDALTGLRNHRTFHEELRRMVQVAQRRDQTLSLALIDVDDFKAVNDTHGHRKGDIVLAHLGRLLAQTRAEDRAFRIGGDEFALLLPGTDVQGAAVVAERFRRRVADEVDGATTSIGIAELGCPAPDVETLLASADLALYDAKGAGRNRVEVFAPHRDLGKPAAA